MRMSPPAPPVPLATRPSSNSLSNPSLSRPPPPIPSPSTASSFINPALSSPPPLTSTYSSTSSSSRSFSTVRDALPSPSGSGTAVSTSVNALDALRDVMEATQTLPCIKYIAGVGIKVLQIIQEVQINNEAVRKVSLRAKDIVLAVARACDGAPQEIRGQLHNDLQQLTETMNEILAFTTDLATRRTYKKILSKADDAAAVQSLDSQLTHAFHIFEIQSSVSLRISQQLMTRQLANMALSSPGIMVTSPPPFNTDTPLRIPDGLYMIRNASDGRVLETEHRRPAPKYVHTFLATSQDGLSQFQLWLVYSSQKKETEYTIQNFATGAVLDVYCGHSEDGTQVISQTNHAGSNQKWAIYGARQGASFDYCTIRSFGPSTILDGKCPAGDKCDYLHRTTLRMHSPVSSQEWSFIRFPDPAVSSPLSTTLSVPSNSLQPMPRRLFRLQNASTGEYATATSGNPEKGNITMQPDAAISTGWFFMHTAEDNYECDDMFALVTGSAPALASLDHWGGSKVAVKPGSCWPTNGFHMWKAVPCGDAFCFRNRASGRMLCQPRGKHTLDTAAPVHAVVDPAARWRLVDARTGEVCKAVYDSALTIPPAELAGGVAMPVPETGAPAPEAGLRIQPAAARNCELFQHSLKREHAMVRDMLNNGYTALVIAPLLVTGWKSTGEFFSVAVQDEAAMYGLPRFRGKNNFNTCHPR